MKLLIYVLLILSSLAHSASKGKVATPESENYVHIFIMRSAYPLNWDSPSKLAKSLIKNIPDTFSKRKISLGHNNLELVCNGETTYAGMRFSSLAEAPKLLFMKKSGLGVLFHNMKGEYDTKKFIDISKKDFLNGKTSIITLSITNDQCQSLRNYIETFKNNNEVLNYGLHNNPFQSISKSADQSIRDRYKQNKDAISYGAGCSAFMVSALQELGITDTETIHKWYSEVKVPIELIGQYSNQIYYEKTKGFHPMNNFSGKKVSFSKVLFKGKRWANENEPHKNIIYYSPNKMFLWASSVGKESPIGSTLLNGVLYKKLKAPKQYDNQAYQLMIDLR